MNEVQIELFVSLELAEDEVWPDGAPETWTAEDVMNTIKELRTAQKFIREWDLLAFGANVEVQARGTSARGHLA